MTSFAQAQVFEVSAKLTCYDNAIPGPARFAKQTLATDALAEAVASFPAGTGDLLAMTVNTADGELDVRTRCDGLVVQGMAEAGDCAVSGHSDPSGVNIKLACPYALMNWGAVLTQGTYLCLMSETGPGKGPGKLHGSCAGGVVIGGAPCAFRYTIRKLFTPSGPCPL